MDCFVNWNYTTESLAYDAPVAFQNATASKAVWKLVRIQSGASCKGSTNGFKGVVMQPPQEIMLISPESLTNRAETMEERKKQIQTALKNKSYILVHSYHGINTDVCVEEWQHQDVSFKPAVFVQFDGNRVRLAIKQETTNEKAIEMLKTL